MSNQLSKARDKYVTDDNNQEKNAKQTDQSCLGYAVF